MQVNGLIGLIILLADIFAILKIANSSESTGMKVLWIVIVLLMPVLGLLAWFFIGPGDKALNFRS